MAKYKWRCPHCGYTTDPAIMTAEARHFYNKLKPSIKDLIKRLFSITNTYTYNGKLNKQQRSKFVYGITKISNIKDVIHGINLYMTQEMYKKGYTLDYLAAIIRNNAERKEITLKAERKMRGIDPPEEK